MTEGKERESTSQVQLEALEEVSQALQTKLQLAEEQAQVLRRQIAMSEEQVSELRASLAAECANSESLSEELARLQLSISSQVSVE